MSIIANVQNPSSHSSQVPTAFYLTISFTVDEDCEVRDVSSRTHSGVSSVSLH